MRKGCTVKIPYCNYIGKVVNYDKETGFFELEDGSRGNYKTAEYEIIILEEN